jgi:hypothetical protein
MIYTKVPNNCNTWNKILYKLHIVTAIRKNEMLLLFLGVSIHIVSLSQSVWKRMHRYLIVFMPSFMEGYIVYCLRNWKYIERCMKYVYDCITFTYIIVLYMMLTKISCYFFFADFLFDTFSSFFAHFSVFLSNWSFI